MTERTQIEQDATLERAVRINDLAYEQAVLADGNEIDMDAEQALVLNAGSLRSKSERRQFKHDFRRHMRNIAEGNPFYQ